MKFRPSFDQSFLPSRQFACKQRYRIDTEDSIKLLIINMEVRNVMLRLRLRKHPYNNPKKSTYFRHVNHPPKSLMFQNIGFRYKKN